MLYQGVIPWLYVSLEKKLFCCVILKEMLISIYSWVHMVLAKFKD